jgi:hypothetical protein
VPSDFDPGGYGIAPPASSDSIISAFTQLQQKSLHDLACKAKMNDLFELAKWSFTVLPGLKCSRRGLTADLTELLEPDMHAV